MFAFCREEHPLRFLTQQRQKAFLTLLAILAVKGEVFSYKFLKPIY